MQCSGSVAIRKMLIETKMRLHLSQLERLSFKHQKAAIVVEPVEKAGVEKSVSRIGKQGNYRSQEGDASDI